MANTTQAEGGTIVRPDVIRVGDYARFFGGNGWPEQLRDRWWKVLNVDTRFGQLEPVFRVVNSDGHTNHVHVTRWVSVSAHPYTLCRIHAREGI